jgi:hypothetical protein
MGLVCLQHMIQTTRGFIALLVLAIGLLGHALPSQVCAECTSRVGGQSGADDCGAWIVQWSNMGPGSCLEYAGTGRCLASANCTFDVTVSVIDNCGGTFWSRLCFSFIDSNGIPMGAQLCGDPVEVPNPTDPFALNGLAVACGQRFSLELYRTGVALPFLTLRASCWGCPQGG